MFKLARLENASKYINFHDGATLQHHVSVTTLEMIIQNIYPSINFSVDRFSLLSELNCCKQLGTYSFAKKIKNKNIKQKYYHSKDTR